MSNLGSRVWGINTPDCDCIRAKRSWRCCLHLVGKACNLVETALASLKPECGMQHADCMVFCWFVVFWWNGQR